MGGFYIAMGIVMGIFGIFFFVLGRTNYKNAEKLAKQYPQNSATTYRITGIILMMMAVTFVGACTSVLIMQVVSRAFLKLFICVYSLVVIAILILLLKKDEKRKKLRFFYACLEKGIDDLSSSANMAHAKLIAKSLKISEKEDLNLIFNIGKQDYEKNMELVEKNNLEVQKANEKRHLKELTKYVELKGSSKRVKMLLDKATYWETEAYKIRNGIMNMANATQQKEINWAARGGFVSGVAGGAAGVAAAVDAQVKNAQIREENAAMRNLVYAASSERMKESANCRKWAQEAREQAELAKNKLVEERENADWISMIEFSDMKCEFTQTGAFKIKVTAEKKEKLLIYDEVEAVIDGTVSAEVYQNGTLTATILMVLPINGLSRSKLEGICLSGIDPNKSYDIQFKPYHLWAIEK